MSKKWEKNKFQHFSFFKKIIPILFINIKESIININYFYLFSKLFQFLNWITILDIIFNTFISCENMPIKVPWGII